MKYALLMATGEEPGVASALAPAERVGHVVAGRPLLHHILAAIARLGVREVRIATSHATDPRVAALVGDGRRWGLRVLRRCLASPRPALLAAELPPEESLLVGRTDVLPDLRGVSGQALVHLFHVGPPDAHAGLQARCWIGWGLVQAGVLARLPGADILEGLRPHLLAGRSMLRRWVRVRALDLRRDVDLPGALALALGGGIAGLRPPAREVRKGVWIAPGASVAPGAQLAGPVFVGEGAVVEEGAEVGPAAELGAGVLVGARARVRAARVAEDTGVAPGLRLEGVDATGEAVTDLRSGARVTIGDLGFLQPLAPALTQEVAGSLPGRVARALLAWLRSPTS
jgi:hypothetical protein